MIRRGAAIAWLLVLAAGCCELPRLAALPRVRGVPASSARTLELIEQLRAAEAPIRALKVIHRISLWSGGASTGALRGLLAVRRPDAYRLRVLGPAGLTALDLLWRRGRFVLEVPARGVQLVGDEHTPRDRLHGVPIDGLARAFLGRYEAVRASLIEDARWSRLVLVERGGARRVLFVRRSDAAVAIDARFEGGRETTRLTRSDHRAVGDVRLAYRVRCDMPQQGLTSAIEVERYDLNPTLPDAAFFAPLLPRDRL